MRYPPTRTLRGAAAALLLALAATCASTPRDARAAWSTTLTPDIRALARAGEYLFAFSYQTVGNPRLTAQCLEPATGKLLWKAALDHMRADMPHVEAVGTAESVFVTTNDPLSASAGYLLSLPVDVGPFVLHRPRPGAMPGLAVLRGTIWTTSGGPTDPVQWHGLNAHHTKFAWKLAAPSPSGCVGRPVLAGRWIALAENGGLTLAAPRTGKTVRRAPVAECTWGDPVALGGVIAVMSSGTGGSMTVAGVDPLKATVRWRVPAPPNPERTRYVPTLTGAGTLALATYAHEALVLDATGAVLHHVPLTGVTRAVTAPAGRVVCTLSTRHVVVVNLRAGTVTDLATLEEQAGALLVSGGHVFVAAGETLRDLGAL